MNRSNRLTGSQHTMPPGYCLLLAPAAVSKPYLAGLIALVLLAGGEFWWLRSAARKRAAEQT